MELKLLREPDAARKLGISASSLRNLVRQQLAPPPVRLGARVSVWPDHELDHVIRAAMRGAPESEVKELIAGIIRARAA